MKRSLLTSLNHRPRPLSIRVGAIVLIIVPAVSGQSTIQFGFEEYAVKDAPPFVTGLATVEDSTSSFPFLQIPAFEGQKFLVGSGAISLQSPNSQPIKSFTVHLFLPRTSMPPWYAHIGTGVVQEDLVGTWQTVQGTYDLPVQSLNISGFYGPEFIRGDYAIDGIEFVTVPEPQTFWLLPIGLTAIAFRPLLKRPKPTRA